MVTLKTFGFQTLSEIRTCWNPNVLCVSQKSQMSEIRTCWNLKWLLFGFWHCLKSERLDFRHSLYLNYQTFWQTFNKKAGERRLLTAILKPVLFYLKFEHAEIRTFCVCPKNPKCPKSERAEIRTGFCLDFGTVWYPNIRISDIHCSSVFGQVPSVWSLGSLEFGHMSENRMQKS